MLYLFFFLTDKHNDAKQQHNSSCDAVLGVYRKLSVCIKTHRSVSLSEDENTWLKFVRVKLNNQMTNGSFTAEL